MLAEGLQSWWLCVGVVHTCLSGWGVFGAETLLQGRVCGVLLLSGRGVLLYLPQAGCAGQLR